MGWPYQQKPPSGWPLDYDSSLIPEEGFWLFDEGSGHIVQDLSGHGNHGTFGAGAASPSWVPGKFGSAISCDGGDYVNLGSMPGLGLKIYAGWVVVSFWTKTTSTASSIMMGTQNLSNEFVYHLRANDNAALGNDSGKLAFFIRSATQSNDRLYGGTTNDTSPLFNDGNWHHLVFATNGILQTVLIYVDGILQPITYTDQDLSSSWNFEHTLLFGANNSDGTPGAFYTGELDNLSIYDRLPSASEIAQLTQYPFCMFKDPVEMLLEYAWGVGAGVAPTGNIWGPLGGCLRGVA